LTAFSVISNSLAIWACEGRSGSLAVAPDLISDFNRPGVPHALNLQKRKWPALVAIFVNPVKITYFDARRFIAESEREKDIDALTRAFSVYRQTEGGTISHGLATTLINRDGKIEKIWRGNAWTPTEVTEAIQAESK
jgi:hypothetical protein